MAMLDIREVDSVMQRVWNEAVQGEYKQSRILEESNLHSTVYFHLRKLIERPKSKGMIPFVYSEMPFSVRTKAKGRKYARVDLAVTILDEQRETPIDLLGVIELKHYEEHEDSIGIQKDLDHLEALQNGIYYPYSKRPIKLRARAAYFLYLVDKGEICFDSRLRKKIGRLKRDGYLRVFLGQRKNRQFRFSCSDSM